MKVAVAQISCSLGDPKANLLKVRAFSRRAKDEVGAELIVFPEMSDTGYSMPVIQEHSSVWTNGFVPGVQEMAKRVSIAIVCGVSERDGSSIYNSQIFVDSQGNIAAKYRKTHLYAVTPVEDGLQAWAALHSKGYDLLITDNNMPRMTGLELAVKTRLEGMKLPIIVASGTVELLAKTDYD